MRSGGDENYVVYDVLLNFLRGARTFVYQENCIDILGFSIGAAFTEKKMADIFITSSLSG